MSDAPTTAAGAGKTPRLTWMGRIAFVFGLLALVLAVAAPLGYRAGVLDLSTALFNVFGAAALCGAIALLLGVITTLAATFVKPRPGILLALLGGIMGGGLLAQVVSMFMLAQSVPPIHDITTDTENPPAFATLIALRQQDGAQNPPAYPGEEVAKQQRAAYPDLETLVFPDGTVDGLLARSEQAARDLGWTVKTVTPPSAAAAPARGLLEATQTSLWFGFTDDVVVRVVERPGGGVALDIRSKSRVGISDLGQNARRIRAFIARIREG
ncbi:MAG: DUF1499 domain-containing protein [Alphaproteobacteria bacterium]